MTANYAGNFYNAYYPPIVNPFGNQVLYCGKTGPRSPKHHLLHFASLTTQKSWIEFLVFMLAQHNEANAAVFDVAWRSGAPIDWCVSRSSDSYDGYPISVQIGDLKVPLRCYQEHCGALIHLYNQEVLDGR